MLLIKNKNIEDFIKNYKTGISEIDRQHAEWLEIIQSFNDLADSTEELKIVVVKMYKYARMHLKYEEKFMENIHFPDLVKHKREHLYLDSLVSNLFIKTFKGEELSSSTLLDEITGWLVEHVMGSDQKIARYVFENNINPEEHLPS